MGLLMNVVSGVSALVMLVCFVMTLINMFQRGETTIGIVTLVLFFCGGIGLLIAFVYGWMKASAWGTKNLMLVWSVAIVAFVLTGGSLYSAFSG